MTIFSYNPEDSQANFGIVTKGSVDKPSVFIDFAGGLISNAVTISTVSAVGTSSVNTTITSQVVGTISTSGTVARLDLKTGGTSGTGAATNGDEYLITATCQPSSGGPITFAIYVNIDSQVYSPV